MDEKLFSVHKVEQLEDDYWFYISINQPHGVKQVLNRYIHGASLEDARKIMEKWCRDRNRDLGLTRKGEDGGEWDKRTVYRNRMKMYSLDC